MNLAAIGIVCSNLTKSINFYESLGLSFEKFGDDHYEAITDSGMRLMLDSVELIKKINPSFETPINTSMILCFERPTSELVDAQFMKLKKQNYKVIKEPWDAFWGQRYSSIQDPDGNQIDIFANLEKENE